MSSTTKTVLGEAKPYVAVFARGGLYYVALSETPDQHEGPFQDKAAAVKDAALWGRPVRDITNALSFVRARFFR